MAKRIRLFAARCAAWLVAVSLPPLAMAGPAFDTDALRERLKKMDATVAQATTLPADVHSLREALGVVDLPLKDVEAAAHDAAAPYSQERLLEAKPALAPLIIATPPQQQDTAPANGLFSLQTGQAQAGEAPVAVSFGAGGLFARQTAQPQVLEAPTALATEQNLITQTAATPLQPAKPLSSLSGAGGLFTSQNALAAGPVRAAQPTGGHAGLAPLDVALTNFRLMLATLAQTYSGVNNLSVITAQGARGPMALSVRSGTVTLADIKSFSAAHGHAPRADGSLTLPVVIWPKATLRLSQGEHLALARDAGAFILSMGRMEVIGAVIEVTGPQNPHEKVFTPFVTIASGGSLHMDGATLRGLGFGRTVKFAGLTVAGNPLMPTRQDVVLRNSLFEGMRTVTVAGAPHAVIEGNTFQDARGNALNIVGSAHAEVRGNLFRGAGPTNAIRVDLGSDNTVVEDNVFLRGERVAVLVNGGSRQVTVRDNLIWRRDGGGVKFLRTECGLAQGNILIDNAQKGIEIRKSNGILVRDNLIAGGRSAAIWVSAQATGAKTLVQGNTFERNASGLSAATGAEIWTQGNDFRQQMPKLLDGDIARLTHAITGDLSGARVLQLTNGQSHAHQRLTSVCGGDT